MANKFWGKSSVKNLAYLTLWHSETKIEPERQLLLKQNTAIPHNTNWGQ